MRRAEVWWAELPPPVKHRPVVVLTRDSVLPVIDSVVVAIVTRTIRGLGSEMVLGMREGLLTESVANFDNLLTVPKQRLVRPLGTIGSARIDELDRALCFALQINVDKQG